MAEKRDIAEVVATLKASFPNFNPMPPDQFGKGGTVEVYFQTLQDLDGDTLRAAILACITESGRAFAPSVGEIRGAALRLNALASGIPSAYDAYIEAASMPVSMERAEITQEVDDEGRTIIARYRLKWSHAIVEAVAHQLGWPKTWPSDNPTADRAQFIRAYETELARQMDNAGRLPVLREYIEKRALTAGPIKALAERLER